MQEDRYDSGFTLAELLVVVAIIGVLVSISIPIFSSQLEKAREATDAANIRSQYAEVMTAAITEGDDVNPGHATYAPIELRQQKDEWQDGSLGANLHGIFGVIDGDFPKAGGQAWVEYSHDKACAILHYKGVSSSSGVNIEELNDKLKLSAKTWPSSGAFSPRAGEVYQYENKLYVANADIQGLSYYMHPDDPGDRLFCMPTSTVLTRQNVDANGRMTSSVNKGDLFVDKDGSIYIHKGTDYCGNIAPDPGASYSDWVKVKTN